VVYFPAPHSGLIPLFGDYHRFGLQILAGRFDSGRGLHPPSPEGFAWRVSAEALAKADNLRRGRHFFEPVHALQSVLALL